MRPEICRIFGLPIHGYGLMIVIGFLLASWLASREARRRGLPDVVYDVGVAMLLSGLVGGRIWYCVQYYQQSFAGEPWYKFFAIWEGGLVFYGGALGGALGGWLFLRRRRVPVAAVLDAMAPFVPIGMAFGRLGCFMNGCCYGELCGVDTFPISVRFPSESRAIFDDQLRKGLVPEGATETLPVFAVQIHEAIIDFALCALLLFLSRGRIPRGGGIPLLFALYSLERFFTEYLRGEDAGTTWTGVSVFQNVSIVLFVLFGSLFARIWWRQRAGMCDAPGSTRGSSDRALA